MANAFHDGDGREWSLRIVHSDTAPLKALGLDLGDEQTFGVIYGFAELAELLWHLCRRQAADRSVDRGSFDGGLDGPTFDAARLALMGAVADFTLPAEAAKEQKARLPSAMERTAAKVAESIRGQSTSNGSDGNSPVSPASTPAREPSAN